MKIAAREKVIQFNLPENVKPEAFLHQLITTISTDGLENDALEIIEVANNIRFELDQHRYITNILNRLGLERASGLAKIIDLASKHPDWNHYTQSVSNWLTPLIEELRERDV